jgi:predicted Zn-dependent protease
MKKKYLSFILCVVFIIGCATSPTGRRQLMIVSEETAISASKQAYVEMLKPYEQQGKVDNDPALKDRVYRITERLIAQAIIMRPKTEDWDWSIKIIDDPKTVNAWAMAGGKMALYSGLVIQLKPTDDELAQVLGHEISHALANHSAEKMSVAMATTVGVVAVGVAVDRNKGLALTGAALAAASRKRIVSALSWQLKRVMIRGPRSPCGRRWPRSAVKVPPNFSVPTRHLKIVRKSSPDMCLR